MRRYWQAAAFASAFAATVLTVSTLYVDSAEGHGSTMGRGGVMGGQMMDHCNQMMGGGSTRPNEQWRKEPPKTPEKKG